MNFEKNINFNEKLIEIASIIWIPYRSYLYINTLKYMKNDIKKMKRNSEKNSN